MIEIGDTYKVKVGSILFFKNMKNYKNLYLVLSLQENTSYSNYSINELVFKVISLYNFQQKVCGIGNSNRGYWSLLRE
jgi:hypothetical protein